MASMPSLPVLTSRWPASPMAQNGNGVNGAENNGTAAPGEIDEGLYSRQLFVLGELKFETKSG